MSDHRQCQFCGETDDLEEMQRCAGCDKLGCYECVEWRENPVDPMDGEYFCEGCAR